MGQMAPWRPRKIWKLNRTPPLWAFGDYTWFFGSPYPPARPSLTIDAKQESGQKQAVVDSSVLSSSATAQIAANAGVLPWSNTSASRPSTRTDYPLATTIVTYPSGIEPLVEPGGKYPLVAASTPTWLLAGGCDGTEPGPPRRSTLRPAEQIAGRGNS